MSRRLERVAEQLRAEIARVIHEEVTDPRIGLVTLIRVDVSPDLGQATVFWSRIETQGAPSLETVQAGLSSAAPFVRRRLAEVMPLRRMPALRFRHDSSLERGDRALEILRSLRDEQTR